MTEIIKKIPEGYKKSPLGIIPINWEVKDLGEVSIIKGDYGINAAAVEYSNSLPTYLRITDIDDEGNFISAVKKSVDNKSSEKYILNNDDIVFARTGATVGKTYLHNKAKDGDLVFAGFLIRFRTDTNKLLPFYLKCFANTKLYWDWVKKISMRSGQPGINSTEYCALKIILPPINEQKAIVNRLSLIDDIIFKLGQLIIKKELQKKVLIQMLITGKKRVTGFENTRWSLKKLDECLLYTPREVPKPKTSFFALGIRSHGKGIFHKNDFEPEELAMDLLYRVEENDLIVNITFAWEQAIAIAGENDEGGLVSHRFPTYTFTEEVATPEFFKYLILQKSFKYQLDLISPGGAGRNRVMSKKEFLKIKVIIPKVEEQKAIANMLDCAAKEIQLLKAKTDKLKEQKKGMMQLLLTGKKRLKV